MLVGLSERLLLGFADTGIDSDDDAKNKVSHSHIYFH